MASAAPTVVVGGIVLIYALRGGSYDLVTRQEEGIALWWVLGLGAVCGLLPRAGLPPGGPMALAVLFLLAAWTALSLLWTESAERTFAEMARVAHYAGLVALTWFAIDRRTWRRAAIGLAIGAVLVCLVALGSRLAPAVFPADRVALAFDTARLNYPFGYWNALAAWAAMSLAMALTLSAHAESALARAGWLAVVPVCGLVVFLTYSRAGLAGSALGILVVLALGPRRWVVAAHAVAGAVATALVVLVTRGQPAIAEATGSDGGVTVALAVAAAGLACAGWAAVVRRGGVDRLRLHPRVARIAVLAGALVLIVVGGVAGGERAEQAWEAFRQPTDVTAADPATRLGTIGGSRYGHWASALRAFETRPVGGRGAGTFEFWRNRDGGGEPARDAHSLPLELLAELGLPGAVLGLLLLGALAVAALRARRRLASSAEIGAHTALLAAFTVVLLHLGVDWIWESTAVAALGLACAAIAMIAAADHGRHRMGGRGRLAVAAVSLIAVAVLLPGLLSTSRVRVSQSALAATAEGNAVDEAQRAADVAPWAATPLSQRAIAEEAADDLRAAAGSLRGAARREPTNWRHQVALARVEARRGRPVAALTAYRRARRLRPAAPLFVPTREDSLRDALQRLQQP